MGLENLDPERLAQLSNWAKSLPLRKFPSNHAFNDKCSEWFAVTEANEPYLKHLPVKVQIDRYRRLWRVVEYENFESRIIVELNS